MENNREKDTFLLKDNFEVKEFELEEIDEYVVTVYHHEDLESFYDDMETHGGTDHVPDRCVECCNRRPTSRNTHYHLSQEEVKTLKQDDRVWDIVPKKLLDSVIRHPTGWTETSSNWDKSSSEASTHRNWGLRRCIDGTQTSNWGSNGTASITGSVTATSSGKNVDVVIVDGFINPNHPEMAVNYDGSGGTRVVQFNWYSLNSSAIPGLDAPGTYPYPATYTAYGDDHGMHVGGTAAGNSQGWARGANVFNIYVYAGSGPLSYGSDFVFDYVREFHKKKAVNPATGLRNPTIMNNSWGSSYTIAKEDIESVVWRGTTYTGPFTDEQYNSFGLTQQSATAVSIRYYSAADESDVQDAINDGVIVVGAAGNEYTKIDVPGGIDYDNRIILTNGSEFYYHRGSIFTSAGTLAAGSICVGAISTLVNESKADFSNSGPRVTIYAPGTQTMSSVHSGTTNDFRSTSFKIDKYGGTSMASPQVCGVLACALEQYPRMTQAQAIQYIQSFATLNQIFEPPPTPYIDSGVSAVSNTSSKITGSESFLPLSNTSVRIITSASAATLSSLTNNLLGAASLTASTTPNTGNSEFGFNDDGFWQLNLPFNISYNGSTYSTIFVNTNSYVLFGTKPTSNTYDYDIGYSYNTTTPTIPKIQISQRDGSAQRIYYGVVGTTPNRTYRVRFEGHISFTGGVLGSPTIVWEMTFYENANTQIDLHMGANPRVTAYNVYKDDYNLQGSGNRYLFYKKDRKESGILQPRDATKTRPTSGQAYPRRLTLHYKK